MRRRLRLGWLCLALLATLPAAAQTITLSTEESAWLAAQTRPIRVGVTDFPPLLVRAPGGDWGGLAIDLLHLYETRLGLRLELVALPSWSEMLAAARRREVDLLPLGVRTPQREAFLHFTRPYVVLRNRIIVRQGERDLGRISLADLRGKRVAVLDGSHAHDRLRSEHPQLILLPVREEKLALTAVAFHEADAAVVETSRANWMAGREGLTNLAVGGDTSIDYPEALAVRSDWTLLAQMLDRVALGLDAPTLEALSGKWLRLEGQGFWDDPRHRVLVSTVVGGLLAAILLVLLWNRALRRTVAARTARLREQVRLIEATELELRSSKDNFRGLAELASDWFWEQDAAGRFTRLYGGGLEKVDLDPRRYIGHARWEMPMYGISAAEIAAHRRLVETRQPFRNFAYQLENRRGERRWIAVNGQPVFAADGSFAGYRGTAQDISERMRDQIERDESLARLRALLDGSFSFVGLLDPGGILLDCNRAVLRFAGVGREQVIGRPLWESPWFSPPDEAERLRAAIAAAARGEFVRYDARHADAAGALYWVDFSLSPIFDERQQVVYLVSEGRDITDAKRAAETLRDLVETTGAVFGAAYFQRLVESLARILTVRRVYVGRLLAERHRVRTEAQWVDGALGDNFEYDLDFSPCDRVLASGCCVYPRTVRQLFPRHLLLQRLDAEAYVGVPVHDSSGRPVGLLVALHDQPLVDSANTRRLMELFAVRVGGELERLDREAEIRRLNAGLEQRVEERTRELMLANRELEAFSYSVSHDLRAPLRHIAGFVEMLEERCDACLDAEARRYIEVIAGSAERMGELIDDLLALSRVGRVDITPVPVDSDALVDEVIADLAGEIDGRQIEWRRSQLPAVVADRALLRQVWFNLLDNALKYTREKPVAVIEIDARFADGSARFEVRDNGVGFNMKHADKLFGVFQRLHRADRFPGTGIGLANVKRIVERHGGAVGADASEGLGARFWFTLGQPGAGVTTGADTGSPQ